LNFSSSELNIGQGEKDHDQHHQHRRRRRHHPHQHTEELIAKDSTEQARQFGEKTKDGREQESPSRPEISFVSFHSIV
jgi:hypothetical protein